MMSIYEFETILKRVYKNRIIYLFFVVEISLGMAILFFSLNHLLSYKKTADKIDSMMMPYETRLDVTGSGDGVGMDLDDYIYISNRYKDNAEIYLISNQSLEYKNKLENCEVIFCDFNKVIGVDQRLEKDKKKENVKFILDMEMAKSLSDIKLYSEEFKILLKKDKIEYEGREYDFINRDGLKIRDLRLQKYEDNNQDESNDNYRIFIDIGLLKRTTEINPAGIRFFLSDKGLENAEKVKYEICDYLKKKHPSYDFRFEKDLSDFNTNNRSDLIYMYVYTFISIVIILLFLIAFTGVFKILMKKREKDLAVNLAFGCNRYRLAAAILIENYLVIFLGSLIGIMAGIKINSMLTTDLFRKGLNPELLVFFMILTILMSFISSIESIYRLMKMEVVDIIGS